MTIISTAIRRISSVFLCILLLQLLSSLADEVAIDAASSGEGSCIPKDVSNDGQKLSTCTSYQITTLNASPRRCMHIETPSSQLDEENGKKPKPQVCTNYLNWNDGTNGCKAYEQNKDWCAMYGGLDYTSKGVLHNASEACCVCGGGNHHKPQLDIDDYVKVHGYGFFDTCKQLQISEYQLHPSFSYIVEVTKECGPNIRWINDVTGKHEIRKQIQPKMKFPVEGSSVDDSSRIEKMWNVELKKCRNGLAEQEFEFIIPAAEKHSSEGIIIQHKLSGVNLAQVLGAKTNKVNITRVFEDELFLGSEEFYYLQITTNRLKLLLSGYFGEKEYGLVQSRDKHAVEDTLQFSMWAFKPVVVKEDASDSVNDEHAQWLLRMTQLIGIDYLDKLPPFHLLDVERDATKSEVKARFRELSKSFHPDKLVNQPEKKDLFERIQMILQDAYQGLKNANEAEKEAFRVQAETSSQIFAHSQHIIELLPFHWTKIEDDATNKNSAGADKSGRYILNVASHINSTLLNATEEGESDNTEQLWVTFMYSARCSMSRSVVGVVDLAARHLAQMGIKVGAYGCGLYKEYPPEIHDPTGVLTDPICAQFQRRETPNVHVIVETLPSKKIDAETGEITVIPPNQEVVIENAMFKYFYASVPNGDTTQFLPHNLIEFANAGRDVWESYHLVHKMRREDFSHPDFISNISIIAFLDGTGLGETNEDIVSTLTNSFPGVARRFVNDDVYVGTAYCGFGDEHSDERIYRNVDCSKLDVSWLPDVKIYGSNMTQGKSLLRGQFGDRRDVQIALESMGNTIRALVGGEDPEEIVDKIDDIQEASDVDGSCEQAQQSPPSAHDDFDLDKIEGEEVKLLEMDSEEEMKIPHVDEAPKKPKLASQDKAESITGSRDKKSRDRVAGFETRQQARRGNGKILGGGAGGGGGFIAG